MLVSVFSSLLLLPDRFPALAILIVSRYKKHNRAISTRRVTKGLRTEQFGKGRLHLTRVQCMLSVMLYMLCSDATSRIAEYPAAHSLYLSIGHVTACCECNNEPSASIICGEFLD